MSESVSSSQPPAWAIKKLTTPSVLHASHVAHSIEMMSSLPWLRESVDDDFVACACTESWMLHVRLLAEFLAPSAVNLAKDITCTNFGLPVASGADEAFLRDCKDVAGAHLVHLGANRFQENVEEDQSEAVTLEYMRATTTRIIEILEGAVSHGPDDEDDAFMFLHAVLAQASASIRREGRIGP